LQQWSSLQQHWCLHSPLSVLQQLEAAEAGGWLLQRLVTQQAQQQMLCEDDVQELQQQSEVCPGWDGSLLCLSSVLSCVCPATVVMHLGLGLQPFLLTMVLQQYMPHLPYISRLCH
jgi:hypothetical protein